MNNTLFVEDTNKLMLKNKKIILNLKVSNKMVKVIDNFIPYVVYTEL